MHLIQSLCALKLKSFGPDPEKRGNSCFSLVLVIKREMNQVQEVKEGCDYLSTYNCCCKLQVKSNLIWLLSIVSVLKRFVIFSICAMIILLHR